MRDPRGPVLPGREAVRRCRRDGVLRSAAPPPEHRAGDRGVVDLFVDRGAVRARRAPDPVVHPPANRRHPRHGARGGRAVPSSARAPVLRRDEIGAVATGLNHMLDELEELHGTLQSQVAQATAELRAAQPGLARPVSADVPAARGAGAFAAAGRGRRNHVGGGPPDRDAAQPGVRAHIQLLLEQQEPGSPVPSEAARGRGSDSGRSPPSSRACSTGRAAVSNANAWTSSHGDPPALRAGPARARERRRPLTFEGGPVRPIIGDVAELELTLLNFVSNALDAMPGGGDLSIRVSDGGD